MLAIFLFLVYFAALLYRFPSWKFIAEAGLSRPTLSILLAIKLVAGLLIGWISFHYYPGNDYQDIHLQSLREQQWLFNDPAGFMQDLFYSPYDDTYGSIFKGIGSFWNDLRFNLLTKSLAVLNFITLGNYYINSLLFNLIGFSGSIALYKLFHQLYPGRKTILIIGCFLLPSTLYFCSGVHKDQIIFAGLSFFCYALYNLLFQSGKFRHYLMLCFATLLIFLFRNYILLALLPAVFSLLLARQLRKNTLFVFSTTYSCLLILLFFLPIDFPLHPFRLILERQAEFKTLPIAHSQIQTPAISSNPISFIKAIPTAFLNTLVRPFFWEIHSFIGFMASLLQFSFFSIYLIGFYKAIRLKIPPRPFPLFLCCFGMTLFLLIGLIVPNYLTIIRYESVLLPLTLIPFLISVFDRRDT